MASSTQASQSGIRRRIDTYPSANLKFDLFFAALSVYFLCGLFLDGWAHNHGKVDDTFVTPWHAVLYSGFGFIGLLLVGTQFVNVLRGHVWTRALPRGYGLGLLGVLLFGAGGGFDFAWHSIFGFEANIEALLSPAHLLLATGAMLFVTAPLRAVWGRIGQRGWAQLLPALVSLIVVYMALTFFTQYAHYIGGTYLLVERLNSEWYRDSHNIFQFLMPAALMMGTLLLAMRRWVLPRGFITLMMVAHTGLMFWLRYQYVIDYAPLLLAPIAGGVMGDALLWWLKPSVKRVGTLRLFAFLMPVAMFSLYFALQFPLYGTNWAVHMWLGVILMTGIVGLFLSYLSAPPAIPSADE
jgi:hypothetical protein